MAPESKSVRFSLIVFDYLINQKYLALIAFLINFNHFNFTSSEFEFLLNLVAFAYWISFITLTITIRSAFRGTKYLFQGQGSG